MSQVVRMKNPGIDAFDLYVKATNMFGAYQAFLLDSLNGPVQTPYEMSLLGVLPLVEIKVKSGGVSIHAEKHLAKVLHKELSAYGPSEISAHDQDIPISYSEFECHDGDPMDILDKVRFALKERMKTTDDTPFGCGFLGYFGYDAIHYLEALPNSVLDDRGLPDIRFQLHAFVVHLTERDAVFFNHVEEFSRIFPVEAMTCLYEMANEFQNAMSSYTTGTLEHFIQDKKSRMIEEVKATEDVPESLFRSRVNRAKEYILGGDIFQVVISKRVRVPKIIHPYMAYARLRQKNPSPYMFMVEYPDMRLFGASPEVQFRSVNGKAQMKPIAGTSKGRGKTSEEDEAYRSQLVNNAKDRAEHIMLVDLCRNDLGRVCMSGTVAVDEFMTVEAYTHLFHLVSTVNGVLTEDVNIFRALLSTFPAGTLSGAPKIRAMEIIDELEDFARGPYGGFVGMVDLFGNANTAIIIRSVVETGGVYYIQAGAGIVADSDAGEEWRECGRKARAVLQVLTDPLESGDALIGKTQAILSQES